MPGRKEPDPPSRRGDFEVDDVDVVDDVALVRLVAEGDMDALRVLYERYAGFVYRVGMRFLGNEEDARDVVQSVFADLIDASRGFAGRSRVKSWLYRVTANRCLNQVKSARVSKRSAEPERELDRVEGPPSGVPAQEMERREERLRVRGAIAELPPRQRMALVLKHYEGLSYKEICKAMGCSRRSVESLLVRARRRLVELLEE